MKKLLLKNTLIAAIAITGMNVFTSCDSCSRKDTENNESTTYSTETDTVAMGSLDTANGTENSGNGNGSTATGTGTKQSSSSGASGNSASSSSAATGSASGSSSSATSGDTKKSGMTQQEITNKIENSSSNATDSKGRPVSSGGTAGSGQGNGTISTGNNGKVNKLEDQKGN